MTDIDLQRAVERCKAQGVGTLCVRPSDVALAKALLRETNTRLCAVVGFPHGSSRLEVKALEARLALLDGAVELDMVMNLGRFLSRDYDLVIRDIAAVVAEARPVGALVKVIIETCLLTRSQILLACDLSIEAGADFVKTSTGFNGEGATHEGIGTMLQMCVGRAQIKASGGIRKWEDALKFVEMGVTRLGVNAFSPLLDDVCSE